MAAPTVVPRPPFKLGEAHAVLERTPATLDAMLRGLPPVWTQARDGADTWTPHEIVAHLINADRTDWIARAEVILGRDPSALLPPFDRTGFFAEANAMPLGDVLDLFAEVRRNSLAILDSWKLTNEELDLTAQHPTFGAVTLRALLATWVAHDFNHLVQAARTMARQYQVAVGPWAAFLGVMPK
jgi:hypothetical protein